MPHPPPLCDGSLHPASLLRMRGNYFRPYLNISACAIVVQHNIAKFFYIRNSNWCNAWRCFLLAKTFHLLKKYVLHCPVKDSEYFIPRSRRNTKRPQKLVNSNFYRDIRIAKNSFLNFFCRNCHSRFGSLAGLNTPVRPNLQGDLDRDPPPPPSVYMDRASRYGPVGLQIS